MTEGPLASRSPEPGPAKPDPAAPLVVCLCAAWCGVCREFRAAFDAAARAHPQLRLAWIDIEDHPDVPGDIDIETFPTLLVSDGCGRGFFGPIEPRESALRSLLDQLARGAYSYDAQVNALHRRAHAHLASGA